MKKRKLKGFVLPTLYLMITVSIFTGIIFISSDYEFATKDYDYTTKVVDSKILPVVSEDESSTTISSPIKEGTGEISVHFYNSKDNEEVQKNSIIYYENTYLPNTGVLYTSDNEFDVLAAFDGKVIDIIEDDFFGKCVVVEHTDNLRTYYYGLLNIEVSKGDEITTGDKLGVSQNNEVMNNKKSFLFEVYHNNKLINPESFVGTKITEYE